MSSEHTTADDSTEDAPMPLEQLSRDKQEKLITAWEDYQDSNDTTNVRRRGFLQAGAALLTGTAIGGGAYALSSEEVAAAANEVGQIGEPGSLVDVYGEDIEAVSVNTEVLTRGQGDLVNQNTSWGIVGDMVPQSSPSSTSSSSYDNVAALVGAADFGRVPAGATLYGNLTVRVNSVPSGETANYRPRVASMQDGSAGSQTLDELEVTATDSGTHSSGWTEITSFLRERLAGDVLQAKVTSGTLDSGGRIEHSLIFEWRVD